MTIYAEDAETKERNRLLQERKARRQERKRKANGAEMQEEDDSCVSRIHPGY